MKARKNFNGAVGFVPSFGQRIKATLLRGGGKVRGIFAQRPLAGGSDLVLRISVIGHQYAGQ
jgi:hypothetical protein